MLNIFGWRPFLLPREGNPARLSNKAQQVLVECNKRQGIQFVRVKREVYLTQILGKEEDVDPNYCMLWSKSDKDKTEFWSEHQNLILASEKNKFLLNLLWRVPPLVYAFNPETAVACITNIWLREILGTNDVQIARDFTDKYVSFVRGLQSRCFPYLLLSHMSAGSHPALPMEIKVGIYLSIIGLYLQSMGNSECESIPNFPTITQENMEELALPISSVGDTDHYKGPTEKTDKFMKKQGKRSNRLGFWTDLLCHYRCIVCGSMKAHKEEGQPGRCPSECMQGSPVVRCSLCNVVTEGELQTILHYTTLCRRAVGDICPVCAGEPLKDTCMCLASSQATHKILRDLIKTSTNPLFRAANVQIISDIMYQHYVGGVTYTKVEPHEADFSWWEVDKVKKEDYEHDIRAEDVQGVLANLPVLSEDGLVVHFPGTESSLFTRELTRIPKEATEGGSPERKDKLPRWLGGEEGASGEESSSASLIWDNRDMDGERSGKKGEGEKKGGREEDDTHKEEGGGEDDGEESQEDEDEDDTEEEDEDDGGKDPMHAKGRLRKKESKYQCKNETHKTPKSFSSSLEKLRHIIKSHKCPYVTLGCKFYNEFEKSILEHVSKEHEDTEWYHCEVDKCNQKFTTKLRLTHHRDIHPKCTSCRKHFLGPQELEEHHPCFDIHADKFPKKRGRMGTYLSNKPRDEIDMFRQGSRDPNVQLAQSMAKLCEIIPMEKETKLGLVESFKKCAALQVAQQNLEKFPTSARRMTRLLIDPPSFDHQPGQKENLGKVADFLGKDLEVWSPSNAPKAQFRNFLSLDELNQKMVAATSACKLMESSACCLLLQRFSTTAKNAIESRCFAPPATLSYRSLLCISQEIYFFLNLEEVAIEAEESRKKEGEHLCEYASRAYKLLSTAALGREVEEKEQYISTNLKRLIFRALPPKLRAKIDNLELRYGITYDSKDLLDFYKTEQLEQSQLRGESLADTSLIEPRKMLSLKKEKPTRGEPKEARDSSEKKEKREYKKDSKKKPKNQKMRTLVQESKLGAVGQLHPSKSAPSAASGFKDPSSVTPKPTYAAQGMAKGPRDLYDQAAKASARADYIKKKKAQLGISEADNRPFCLRCGADGSGFHVASKCSLPNTDEIHQCSPTQRLFHRPEHCPNKKTLRSIKVGAREG